MQTLTLFVSSPGDVRDERQAVGRIVERLQARYWNFIRLEPVLWEKEPLRATAHFNEELIRPSDCDLFVCILWSRLGSPLPSQFNRKDGTRFDSGTEWELEEATDAFEERAAKDPAKAKPDILVYRRMSEPAEGGPGDAKAKREQRKKLDVFCERFFFNKDKTIRRAFSPYETVDEFMALFEQHLEKLLLRHIRLHRGLSQDAVRPLPLEGSPFMGLGAFEFDDASLFFGRNRPIAEALAKLKENHAAGHAFLLIYGGSGYGKSSLMKAGLAPRLMADGYLPEVGTWAGAGMLPIEGDAPPLETLARAVIEALPELAKIRDTSAPAPPPQAPPSKGKGKKKPQPPSPAKDIPVWDSARLARMMGKPEDLIFAIAAIVAALDRVSAGKPAHLLVLVDQLEEIFTARAVTPEIRDGFFHVLAALAMSRRIWVVATMRSEFFPRVPEHRDLFQLVRHGGGYILSPPELPELHQIIRYPALAAGLQFERHPENGRDLSEQIYQDASDAHDALPLLEFTLEELYQRRVENVLTWAAYEELGGLAGAIARRAQETYDALPSETRREAARHIFGELVTLDAANEGPATRRRARRETLHDSHPGAPAFLDAFINAKLLVTGSEDNAATVTLAHEALITHWPVLKQWIEDHRDLLLARRRLEDAARLWTEGRQSPKFFLAEGRLAEAERVATSGVFRLSAEEIELVRLSRIRARRKLRILQASTTIFACLAVGAGALGVIARNKAKEAATAEGKALDSAAETRRSLAAADFDAGAGRIDSGSPDEGLPFLIAALENDPKHLDAQALLLETLRRTAWHFPVAEIQHPLPVKQVAFGTDGGSLYSSIDAGASGEGFNTTLRWDLQQGSIASVLMPEGGEETQTLSVAPGGRRVIIQRGYKAPDTTLLCDAETLKPVRSLHIALGTSAGRIAWSAEGALLAYPTDTDGGLAWVIADANTGETIRQSDRIDIVDAEVLSVQLDRERMRAIHSDGTLVDLPLSALQPMRTGRPSGTEKFSQAQLSPDGTELLAHVPTRYSEPELAFYYIRENEETKAFEFGPGDIPPQGKWLDSAVLRKHAGWNSEMATLWTKLLKAGRAGESLPLQFNDTTVPVPMVVDDSVVRLADVVNGRTFPSAPVRLDAAVNAVAFDDSRIVTGTTSGRLMVHRLLPRMDHSLKMNPGSDQEVEGWSLFKTLGPKLGVEARGNDMRLVSADGKSVPLEKDDGWMVATDVALSADGLRLVVTGYGSGSGGFVSPGVVLSDPATGRIVSDLEPIDAVGCVTFLGSDHRFAVSSGSEVQIFEAGERDLKKLAAIPVVGAIHLYALPHAGLLAIATKSQVTLHATSDFSQVAALPFAQPVTVGDRPALTNPWAEDAAGGWLAFAADRSLTVWSTRGARTILGNFPLAKGDTRMTFEDHDGMRGVMLAGANEGYIPLVKVAGLSSGELSDLKAFSEGLAGTRFADGGRTLVRMTREERCKAFGKQPELLKPLFPGADPVALQAEVLALPFTSAASGTWLPVWQRLAAGDKVDSYRLARWASALGDHPWFRQYLRNLIAKSDEDLFDSWTGKIPEKEDGAGIGLPEDPQIGRLHELVGDSPATRDLKQASWAAARTMPERLGAVVTDAEWLEDFPEMDAEKVRALDVPTLEKLKADLLDAKPDDWRVELLTEYANRGTTLALLDANVEQTRKNFESDASPDNALAHAEALALRGESKAAAEFLAGKIPAAAELTLEQAHFLLSSGLEAQAREAIDTALPKLASSWLWRHWLQVRSAGDEPFAPLVERTMDAVGGEGPAAVEALRISLEKKDAEAIAVCLKTAKELPGSLRVYAAGAAFWADGKTAEAFALWPDGFPEIHDEPAERDWSGWDKALPSDQEEGLFEAMGKELATLEADPEAAAEANMIVAARLLEPATTATFGIKRVRDAMVKTGLILSGEKSAAGLVEKMVAKARLAGAPNLDCLRIEARSFMATGKFTAAYARWLDIIDSDEGAAYSSDYLEAAHCVLEDMQDAAAIELLLRAKDKFPTDTEFTSDAAWLLLTTSHPEEAGIMLEHGFGIPFTEDQKQVALAMLVCAAEQTLRADRADTAFKELVALSEDWGTEKSLKELDWPKDLKQSLLAVAKRNR